MNKTKLSMAAVLACSSMMATVVWGGEEKVSMFDGQSLKGWTVITCEAKVDGGDILIAGGNGLVQSERKYRDFVLELDWKALKTEKWDSGIYFRYTGIAPKRPWPLKYQVNLRQGDEGNVANLVGAKSQGLVKPGEWNHFKFTVRGSAAELEINGKPAWKADGLEVLDSHIALQAEVPGGGQYRFRNIYITELK